MGAILVAAGSGRRFGGAKQLTEAAGRPLWQWASAALVAGGAETVVVVGPVVGGIPGGPTRRESVAAGLAALPDDVEVILVHDAARPAASPELVRRVVERVAAGDVDAAVPAVPVRDTIKRVVDGVVTETVDRRELVAVQTPQGFRAEALRRVHQGATGDPTDDASMVEAEGGRVAVVAGDPANLKVTYPADLALVAQLLAEGT